MSQSSQLVRQYWIDCISRLAPNEFRPMLESPEAAIALLEHDEAMVRQAAICACHAIWKLNRQGTFVEILIHIVQTDSDVRTRDTGVDVLAHLFENSKNREIQRLFVQVAKSLQESTFSRNTAYRGIQMVESGWSIELGDRHVRDVAAIMQCAPVCPEEFDEHLLRSIE